MRNETLLCENASAGDDVAGAEMNAATFLRVTENEGVHHQMTKCRAARAAVHREATLVATKVPHVVSCISSCLTPSEMFRDFLGNAAVIYAAVMTHFMRVRDGTRASLASFTLSSIRAWTVEALLGPIPAPTVVSKACAIIVSAFGHAKIAFDRCALSSPHFVYDLVFALLSRHLLFAFDAVSVSSDKEPRVFAERVIHMGEVVTLYPTVMLGAQGSDTLTIFCDAMNQTIDEKCTRWNASVHEYGIHLCNDYGTQPLQHFVGIADSSLQDSSQCGHLVRDAARPIPTDEHSLLQYDVTSTQRENTTLCYVSGLMVIVATRSIACGEELFRRRGVAYWCRTQGA